MADLAFLAPAEQHVPAPPSLQAHVQVPSALSAQGLPAVVRGGVLTLAAAVVAKRRIRGARAVKIVRQAEAEEKVEAVATEGGEAEQIFREAYQAEAERAALLGKQLEAALTEQLGVSDGIKINIEAPAAPAPNEPGGSTWRKAYEDIKARTASLEGQLQRARRFSEPAQAQASEDAEKAEANFSADANTSSTSNAGSDSNFGFPQPPRGAPMDPMQQVQKLREIATISDEEESVLRLVSLAALPNREGFNEEQAKYELPPLNRAREVLSSEDFMASDAMVFERCYVFPGTIPSGRDPAQALDSLQSRLQSLPSGDEVELFLQRQKESGKSLLIMVHKNDLPDDKMEAWQWLIFGLLIVITFIASVSTPLAVVPVSAGAAAGTDMTEMTAAIEKVIPIAACILATVAAQESARRAVASNYGVKLTPPYLLPAWPIGTVGCLGVVSRRMSTAPNRESEVNMSLAAPIAGLVVSVGLILAGLAIGPETDNIVNLNYQILPVVMRLILRPLLGTSSVTTQPDPFADPTILAFPANPLLVGGACGLIITALTLLPIGRLDGGVLARNALGGFSGPLGILAFALLLYGSFGPDDSGSLYLAFAVSAVIWQGGSEAPPKEAIKEINPAQQILAIVLVLAGLALSIPGYSFPSF